MPITRRDFVAGSAALGVGAPVWPVRATQAAPVDLHLQLDAEPATVALRPGPPTRVWRYRARVLRGDPAALQPWHVGFLGPVIRVRRGQRLRIDLVNGLPEPTITHWHGLHVPDTMDGHPRFAVSPGERYEYEFTVQNRAGTYWFHPHPHGRTGAQIHAGLAGLLLVTDDEEAELGLPEGDLELPLVVQDRSFDADNQFVYPPSGGTPAEDTLRGGMMGRPGMGMRGGGMRANMAAMMGVFGDTVLVNGTLPERRDVPAQPHRLRVLNACNARTLKLAWHDGTPMQVIGGDGGLLAAPAVRPYVMLSPGERLDLWVDFARWPAGSDVRLRSLAFDTGMPMGRMMGPRQRLPDGAAFDVMRWRVGPRGRHSVRAAPSRLSSVAAPSVNLAENPSHPKVFDLTMGRMRWGINGRSFEMDAASELETVRLGTHELWEFRNEGQGSMMGMVMPHAMHVHGPQFRVIERSIAPAFERNHRTVRAGLVDSGWKDTVLVMPGERARVLLHFAEHAGLFLYHCHMLEHEDTGLMRNYRVLA